MENSKLDIQDEDDRMELDAPVVRVNEHQASIFVVGHPFPNYVVMLSIMLEEHKELKRLLRKIAETEVGSLGTRVNRT